MTFITKYVAMADNPGRRTLFLTLSMRLLVLSASPLLLLFF